MAGNEILSNIEDIPMRKWEILSEKRIFFGHQSVGYNILDGIKDVMATNPMIKLNIKELDQETRIDKPGFYHARVGSNSDPVSKVDDFASKIDAHIGGNADVAFFKFCFVDIGPDTEINQLFQHYKETMAALKTKYPGTIFVHCTVPLSTTVTSWKTKLKLLLKKKEIWEYDSNIRKNEYNKLVRQYYSGKEPLFDIAYFESLYPDNSRSSFSLRGTTFFDLAPEYTYDDGHLNKRGRRWVAEHLLSFLAEMPAASTPGAEK